jgi:hypothetical protein
MSQTADFPAAMAQLRAIEAKAGPRNARVTALITRHCRARDAYHSARGVMQNGTAQERRATYLATAAAWRAMAWAAFGALDIPSARHRMRQAVRYQAAAQRVVEP